jgi:hypothetical protein
MDGLPTGDRKYQRVQPDALRLDFTTPQWPIVAYKGSRLSVVTFGSVFSDLNRISTQRVRFGGYLARWLRRLVVEVREG